MKKLASLLFALIFCASLVNGQNKDFNISYPTPGRISIIASTPIPEGREATINDYYDLIDCGFNMGMSSGTLDFFNKQFSLIKGLDFKYMVQNADLLSDKRSTFIIAYSKNPQFAGWKFRDEPQYKDLEQLKQQYDAQFKADPHNLIYVNLVGVLEKTFTGNLKSFYSYLEEIQSLIQPEIWSYDYYPILTKNGKLQIEYDNFYMALESFKKISKTTGKPFWAFCESMAYKASSYSRPVATEAYLRYEAFTALAYGAQGIVYWTYGLRKSNSAEDYTSALVNLDGKKTKAWYAAQKVNKEIQKFNHIFYQCDVKDLRHTGSKIYTSTVKLNGKFGPFRMIRSQDSGVVASLIENNNQEYVVIVNRDVLKKQKISLELLPNQRVVELTGVKTKEYNWKKDINLVLDPGGYSIFQVK